MAGMWRTPWAVAAAATALCLANARMATAAAPTPLFTTAHFGVNFGFGEASPPEAGLGTNEAAQSLANLAATGATHVRLGLTWYQPSIAATTVAPCTRPGSPLRSIPTDELTWAINAASNLGLQVLLTPQLDLDWDLPASNVPLGSGSLSGEGLGRWAAAPGVVSRADIGAACSGSPCSPDQPLGPNRTVLSESEWTAWFAAYREYVLGVCKVAAEASVVAAVDLAFGLDTALLHPPNLPRWKALVADARAIYSGHLTLTASSTAIIREDVSREHSLALWGLVDMIGVDATAQSLAAPAYEAHDAVSGGPNTTLADERVVVTPTSVSKAWAAPMAALAKLAAAVSKPLLFTKVGYQSRPNCIVRPSGVPRLDCSEDCSCWMLCRDPQCQASAYQGFAAAAAALPESVLAGVYWFGWTSDPTAGGPSDMGYTPFGKPAESVIRALTPPLGPRAHGNSSGRLADWSHPARTAHSAAEGHSRGPTDSLRRLADELDARTAAHATTGRAQAQAARAAGRRLAGPPAPPRLNGFVFGWGEWTHPNTTVAEAKRSLDSLATTGANSVEFTPMWYFNSQNSTEVYPIGWGCDGGGEGGSDVFPPTTACNRTTDDLRTVPDADFIELIQYAQSLGLDPIVSPMLDPDYHHFKPFWTRDCQPNPWRGTIGTPWGSDCSTGSMWAGWHANYLKFLLHYAAIANTHGVRHFVVTHELYIVNENCNAILEATVASIRAACPGCSLSTVVTRRPLNDPKGMGPPWYGKLDMLATDYYPAKPIPHPALPWQSPANLSAIYAEQIEADLQQYQGLSKYFGGMPVLVTEYGFQSQPWAYSYESSGLLDLTNCDVLDQCVSLFGQAEAYDLSLAALYAQPWFAGVQVWLWQADPTHGGESDDTFCPRGKPSIQVLSKYWDSAE